MSQEIYNKTVFKRFFEENDPAVMEWAENVLEKVSSPGILPTFIKKDGEDFKAYWETVCHIFALVVLYAKQYNEIDTNKILFELFIENRGLVTDEVDTLEQMQYLFDNYVREYRKRGTIDVVNKEGTILGELLRLIRYKTEEEFIFALLMARDTGWTMGYSSPTWNRTDTVLNVTKGYETTTNITDLNAYPLVNPTGVVVVSDIDNDGNPIQAMTFVGNSLVGISSAEDKSKLLPVSENLTYQLSFKVKSSSVNNQNLKFGVEVFNKDKQGIVCKESYGNVESTNFIPEGGDEPQYDYSFSTDLIEQFPNVDNPTLEGDSGYEFNNMFFFFQQDGTPIGGEEMESVVVNGDFTATDHELKIENFSLLMDGSPFPIPSKEHASQSRPMIVFTNMDASHVISPKGVFQLGGFDPSNYGAFLFITTTTRYQYMHYIDTNPFSLDLPNFTGAVLIGLYTKKPDTVTTYPTTATLSVVADSEASLPIVMNEFYTGSLENPGNLLSDALGTPKDGQTVEIYSPMVRNFVSLKYERYTTGAIIDGILMRALANITDEGLPPEMIASTAEPMPVTYSFWISFFSYPITLTRKVRFQTQETTIETVTIEGENIPVEMTLYDTKYDIPAGMVFTEYIEVTSTSTGSYDSWVLYINEVSKITTSQAPVTDGILRLPFAGVYCECRGILSKKDRAYASPVDLNFLYGRGLQMKEGTSYLSLSLTQDRSQASSSVYIYDIKIKPIFLPFYQGHLGEKDVIAAYYKNNSLVSNEGVKDFMETYLVAYKNIIGDNEIHPLVQKKVIFKVISDRGSYIEGAKIFILEDALTTNRNGEADIVLFPGDYSVDVEKNLFLPIKDYLLSVLEDEEDTQIEYILLQGDVYERKITFIVRNEQGLPISGAQIVFNGEFKNTDSYGNAVFYAFPGLYPYTVTKDGYYTINKNINVQDDQSEPVEMILIPLYDLTFVVTNASTGAVEGANVTLVSTEKSDENALAVSQSRRTGTDGKAVFNDLLGGKYFYLVEKQNWIPVNGNVTLDSDKEVAIDFNPMPTYNMVFTVNDYNTFTGEKVPLQGVTVYFAGLTKVTDSSGQASFEGVLGGKYTYDIRYTNDYQRVTVENYEFYGDANLTIDLARLTYKTTIKVIGAGGVALTGATVIVDETHTYIQKDSSGIVLDLPNGTYKAVASYEEYNDKEQSFTVNRAAQTVTIDMSQILYNLTFVVTEDNGSVSNGTRISLNSGEQEGLTNNGQVTFQVPRNLYNWVASKQYFKNQVGVVQPNDLPKTVYVAMPRKEVRVQFYVYNSDMGLPVSGASIKPEGLSTQNTGSDGTTTFIMQMGKTYVCEISVYDYQTTTYSVTVNQESMPQQRVGISNKTYNAHITVKSRNGYNINRAYVTYGGKSGYTNSSGLLTLTGIQSGTYDATCTATNYQSQTKYNVVMSGSDVYIDFVLDYDLITTYIYLRKENVLQAYTSVSVRTTAPDGSTYSNTTEQTNGSGRVTVSSPSGGYVYASASDSQCVSTGEEITDAGGSSIYLYLWKALIVTYSGSPQTPSVSSGVYEIVGSEVRVQGGSRNTSNPSTVYANFRNHTRATAIKQWPESFSIQGSSGTYNVDTAGGNHSAFRGCTSLSSIATNTIPSISGGVICWFRDCTSLRSIPSGLFTKMTGNSCAGAFWSSGVTSLPSGQLVPTSCVYHSSLFRSCKSLTSCVGNGTFGRGGGTEDFHAVFFECTALKNTGGQSATSSPFSNSTNAQYMQYTFQGCTAITELPVLWFRYCTNIVSFVGCFVGCTSLVDGWSTAMFSYSSKATNMQSLFENCTYLSIPYGQGLPSSVTNASRMFANCRNLSDISSFDMKNGKLQNAESMFENTGVKQIPAKFFNDFTTLTNLRRCFAGCTSLTSFGRTRNYVGQPGTSARPVNVDIGNQFNNTNFENISGNLNCTEMFANCTNLSLGTEQTYAVSYTSLYDRSVAGVGKVNMDRMFYGCSKLGTVPVIQILSGSSNYVKITESGNNNVTSHSQTFTGTNCKGVPSGWK